MSEWFYKATNARLDHHGTLLLAGRGFLCRSAYTSAEAWVAHVQSVAFGDVLHCYFIGRKPKALGAFEVVRREDFQIAKPTPTANDFAGPVPGCALYEVTDPSFISQFDPTGAYEPDPKLHVFTGWLIRRIGPPAAPPRSFLAQRPPLVRREVGAEDARWKARQKSAWGVPDERNVTRDLRTHGHREDQGPDYNR